VAAAAYAGPGFATRAPVIARHGMAATAQPLATQVAIDVLKAGGSAIDAAIAANAALGLMEPVGCGIGGDLYAIVWDPKTGKLYGFNGSGRSPAGRSLEDLRRRAGTRTDMPTHGSLTVTVPGAVDGWFALHQRFGKLPMNKVLEPAIRLRRRGLPVSQLVADYWTRNFRAFERNAADIEEIENAKKTYLVDGRAPAHGGDIPQPGPRAHLSRHRKARPRRLLQGRAGPRHGRLFPAHRGRHATCRPCRP
jgi:gamma-glutamyltranspeptidase/glutathione hydrolase